MNPTDHFLSVLSTAEAADTVVAAYQAAAPSCGGGDGGKADGTGSDVEAGLAGEASEGGSLGGLEGGKASLSRTASDAAALVEAEHPRVPFAFQTAVLSVRMLRNWGRNPMMLAAEAVQVGVGGWMGGLWGLRGCHRA